MAVDDIDRIRREMALIRRDMHYDVSTVVDTAESFLNWRDYLRKMPWVAVGLAAAAGYFLVPRKHAPEVQTRLVAPRVHRVEEDRAPGAFGGVLKGLLDFAWPVALNVGRNYLVNMATGFFQSNGHQDHDEPAAYSR